MTGVRWILLAFLLAVARPAGAGPPYFSDDPEPTDYRRYEIYLFTNGTTTRDGTGGAAGIDFNYGAAPDLQLTAVLPLAYESAAGGTTATGVGNIELASKYRFLHQDTVGLDVSVFPRLFLPAGSSRVGEDHASLLLPIWVEKDWAGWSSFGGGGCVINRGGEAQDFCIMGWALTRQVSPHLQLGAEVYHQTADTRGTRATTGVGGGLRYDVTENYHLLAYTSAGIQNADETNRSSWYAALLFTY
jgi:hypothetical protein